MRSIFVIGSPIEYLVTDVIDGGNITYHQIEPWIYSRYIRLVVLEWNNNVSVRMELYGCQQEELAYCMFVYLLYII